MKKYSIEPGKYGETWQVKIEGVALESVYDKYDEAIEEGTKLAQNNKPSTLTLLNQHNEVIETRTFED